MIFFTLRVPALFAQTALDSSVTWRAPGNGGLPSLDTTHTGSPASQNAISLYSEHILSLYSWHANINYYTGGPAFSTPNAAANPTALVQVVGKSELQQETSTLTSEATAVLTGTMPIASGNALAAFLTMYGTSYAVSSSNQFATQSLGLITNLLDGYGLGGLQYGGESALFRMNVGAGIARQSQTVLDQYGTILRSEIGAPAQSVGDGEIFQGSAIFDERFFPNQAQRYSNDRVYSSLLSILPGDGTNNLSANFNLARRYFYFSVDSSSPSIRQERRELSAAIADSLEYPIVPSALNADVNIAYQPRLVTRTVDASTAVSVIANGASLSSLIAPNDVSDLGLVAEARLVLYGDQPTPTHSASGDFGHPFTANAVIHYEEHDESVTLRSADIPSLDPVQKQKLAEELNQASYSSKVTQLLLGATYAFTSRDTLSANGGARILRYDTPDPLNHDDRDELLTNANFSFVHTFSDRLSSSLGGRLSRSHLVYLESDRSAQNNVMRTIAMTTATTYASEKLTEALRAEVFANYTVLDYASDLPELATSGSYLLRGIDLRDTTILWMPELGSALRDFFFFTSELNILERGSYNDSAFSEHPIANNLTVSGTLTYGITDPTSQAPYELQAGIRGFLLRRTGIDETLLSNSAWTEFERQLRIGPIVSLTLNRASITGPRLSGDLWYGFVSISEQNATAVSYSHQLESHLSVQWTF